MNAQLRQEIDRYLQGALSYMPLLPQSQLVAMVILHFNIPDKEAEAIVSEQLAEAGGEQDDGKN